MDVNVTALEEGVKDSLTHVKSLARWAGEFDKLRRCGELLDHFSSALSGHVMTIEKLLQEAELAFEQARSRGELLGDAMEYKELLEKADAEIEELYNDADMFNVEFVECAKIYELASQTGNAKLRAAANALFDAFPSE